MADNAIDIITARVTSQITQTFEGAIAQLNAEAEAARGRADALFDELQAEGRRRMDELFAVIPTAPVASGDFDPIGWIKAQAASRAWRTLVQGLLAVVLVAAGNVVTQSIANPNFDLFSWDDWKITFALIGTAALTAIISYLQNSFGIKPPKV